MNPLNSRQPKAAIVDYRLGNLFSVRAACEAVGLDAEITGEIASIERADAIILPGVGAFADAMAALRSLRLDRVIIDAASRGTPIMGVCLGMQLLMTESEEFGRHPGLGLVEGVVAQLAPHSGADGRTAKVPHVGWGRINATRPGAWQSTPLETTADGAFVYFVHSYVVAPADPAMALATTSYGGVEFCAAVGRGNLFGCQFHPERSGPEGLEMYRRFAAGIRSSGPEARE